VVYLVHLVQLDGEEDVESEVLLAQWVQMVSQVHLEAVECQVLMAHLDQRDRMGTEEKLVPWVLKGNMVM